MELVILILLALHLLLCLFYAWDWFRDYGRVQEALLRLLLCLLLPCLGFLLCKLSDYFREKAPDGQMEELYLGHGEMLDELELLRPVDVAAELEKAPAVDTLRTGEYSFRRRMVMDTLKEEDTEEYLSVLQDALSNEDQETSHYASTVIMDLQKRIQVSLLQRQRDLQEDPEDPRRQEELEEELMRVITSGAFDGASLERYCCQYRQLSDQLLAQPQPQALWFHHRVAVDQKTGELRHAQETALRFAEAFPDSEDAVVDVIQVCLALQDRELLDSFLRRLKDMPVVLTSKSLQYIRFLNNTQ